MTEFARYFKLKDATRTDFRLSTASPEHLRLYVDLDGSLPRLKSALRDTTPLLVVEGDFGTGKSHLLRYVQYVLLAEGEDMAKTFDPVYVELSGFKTTSGFISFHQQIMPKLLEKATAAMQAPGADREKRIDSLTNISDDMRSALRDLGHRGIGGPALASTVSSQWLMATKIPHATLTKARLRSNLFEEAGPSAVVDLYKAIGALYKNVFGKKLLLLLDEAESFSNIVNIDAQTSIGAGMRTLFDHSNESLGFFLGLNTPTARKGVHPMLRSDVQSRVGDRQIKLSLLRTPEMIAKLMDGLWEGLTSEIGSRQFFLDRAAFDLMTQRLNDLRRRLARDPEQLTGTPSPRDLLNVLSDIGRNAVDQGLVPPISADKIRQWYALTKS